MTWGTKLLLAFAAFALLMSTLVYKCMHQNFELVSKDYYTDELRYQDKIDGMNNARKIGKVSIEENTESILIKMPPEIEGLAIKGNALFYCNANSKNDRDIPLNVTEDGLMLIDKSRLAKAAYRVKLTWQTGKEQYYTEQNLTVN
jgi:hypothetical protein